ncbi:MAG: hypothetical protein ACR2NH_08015 [Solirubrobacteraceae bacterium]
MTWGSDMRAPSVARPASSAGRRVAVGGPSCAITPRQGERGWRTRLAGDALSALLYEGGRVEYEA